MSNFQQSTFLLRTNQIRKRLQHSNRDQVSIITQSAETAFLMIQSRFCLAIMLSSSLTSVAVICTLFSLFAGTSAQWQLTSLASKEMSSASTPQLNTSLAFTLQHASSQTSCSQNWAQYPVAAVPTSWTKCQDPLVRFRIGQFIDASNFTFELMNIAQVQT